MVTVVLDFFHLAMLVLHFFLLLVIVFSFANSASPQAKTQGKNARPAGTMSGKSTRPTHPNIILITLDTTRADRMGFLGSNRGLTPNLDHLAEQSVVFTHAYAQVPLTTPSHAALLTGTYPQFNHLEDLGAPGQRVRSHCTFG